MGWADALLGPSNPFAQYADSNPILLASIGAGLASGQNISAGLSNAVQAMPGGMQAQNAYNQTLYDRAIQQRTFGLQQAQWKQAGDWATAIGHPELSPALASGTMTMPDAIGIITNRIAIPPGGSSAPTYATSGLAPQGAAPSGTAAPPPIPPSFWGRNSSVAPGTSLNPDGTLAPPQSAPAPAQQSALPPGVTMGNNGVISNRPLPQTGYQWNPDGTQSIIPGGPADPVAIAAAAKAKALSTASGTDQAAALKQLPQQSGLVNSIDQSINALKSDKAGFNEVFGSVGNMNIGGIGIPQQMIPGALPGTAKANYLANLNQAKSLAFLQGFKMLQGAGRITEKEAGKAQDAYARISTAQSPADFIRGLNDFQAAVHEGYAKLQAQALGNYDPTKPDGGVPAYQPAPMGPAGTSPGGLNFKVR